MGTSFSELIGGANVSGEKVAFHIPEDWMQGRTTYGGLSAALCLETTNLTFSDLPPLRSALVSFIGPAGGDVTGEARILRKGKSVTFVEADIIGEKGLATRTVFAFGAGRDSLFDTTFTPKPPLKSPDLCEPYIPEGFGPAFSQRFESRLVSGARPYAGSDCHDHYIWVRHREPNTDSIAALIAIADMPPPAVMPMLKELAAISSMTWMMNIVTEKPTTKDGWWLLQSRAESAIAGYSSQDMLVWNVDGDLVIAGRQSVAVFA